MNARSMIRYLFPLTVVTIAALTTILFYPRQGGRDLEGADFTHDLNNPFHEAVVLYFHDKKDDAKRLLLRLARQDKFAAQAFINYGLFCEREKDYSEAGDYYRKALARGENMALAYLINLHVRLGTQLPGHALAAAGNLATPDTGCWVEYRKAEERLQKNDRSGARNTWERPWTWACPSCRWLLGPAVETGARGPRLQGTPGKGPGQQRPAPHHGPADGAR